MCRLSRPKRYSNIGCIWRILLQCASSNGSSDCFCVQLYIHIDCTCSRILLQSEILNAISNFLFEQLQTHIDCIWTFDECSLWGQIVDCLLCFLDNLSSRQFTFLLSLTSLSWIRWRKYLDVNKMTDKVPKSLLLSFNRS